MCFPYESDVGPEKVTWSPVKREEVLALKPVWFADAKSHSVCGPDSRGGVQMTACQAGELGLLWDEPG